eukprot:7298395-Alexandrium_andersonii.AAC.1
MCHRGPPCKRCTSRLGWFRAVVGLSRANAQGSRTPRIGGLQIGGLQLGVHNFAVWVVISDPFNPRF